MYILNITKAIKKMSINKIRDFIFENYFIFTKTIFENYFILFYLYELDFLKKQLLFNEILEKKKDLLLFANKNIKYTLNS